MQSLRRLVRGNEPSSNTDVLFECVQDSSAPSKGQRLETGGNQDQMQVAAMRKIAEFMDEELEAALIEKTIDEDKT